MNLLGKIFTVLIFVMSVLFMAFAVMTFATHQNWRERATDLKKQIEDRQLLIAQLEARISVVRNQLEVERASRRAVVGTLAGKLAAAEVELKQQREDLESKTSQLTAAAQAAKTAEELLASATTETAAARIEVNQARADRDNQFKNAVSTYDKLSQATSMLDVLNERNRSLQDDLASVTRVATAHGLTKFDNVDGVAPPLDARVLKVKESSGLVEISVGSDDGIKVGHTMEVYRGNKYLGQIIIRDTDTDRAVGEINTKLQRARIVEGDHVTTKLS